MTYLVIGYDLFLTVGHYGIFLLIAGDNDLDAFLKISLTYGGTVIADRTERCLVYNVGKLCARCARSHACNNVKINIRGGLYLLCVNAEDSLASGKVGQLDGYAAVKASGTCKRGIERLGTVGRGENDNAVVAAEAVHLGQQLVERLLALVVSAYLTVALFSYCVYLVDKYDAGRFFPLPDGTGRVPSMRPFRRTFRQIPIRTSRRKVHPPRLRPPLRAWSYRYREGLRAARP